MIIQHALLVNMDTVVTVQSCVQCKIDALILITGSIKWTSLIQFCSPYATFSFSSNVWSCFTSPYAIFSFSSILLFCVSTSSYTTAAWYSSCVFDAGLGPCPFLLHLMMQTVSKLPHRAPAMNATNTQTTAVMAMVAAVDKLFSGTGIKSRKTD